MARRRRPIGDRAPLAGRAPRAIAHVFMYPPSHNAGAESMLHAMLRELVWNGWEVVVLAGALPPGTPSYWLDGVQVKRATYDKALDVDYDWCDVAITHLDATRQAMAWARYGRPLVHLVHNHVQLTRLHVGPAQAALVVWNSEWVAKAVQWDGPSIVVRPPTRSKDYATVNPDRFADGAVTLVNLADVKGGSQFMALAEARPDLRFLGVYGAYGGQAAPDHPLPNLETVANTAAINGVYVRTRVLVVPSSYESWGKAAVEALASGIPVIATPTEGLVESCTSSDGPAVLFVERDDHEGRVAALASLDDRDTWEHWSARALARSAELDAITETDLAGWLDAMAALAAAPMEPVDG